MSGTQGKRSTEDQVNRVKYLLAKTELSAREIAIRMGFSTSTVISINRRSNIRRYNGKRSHWETVSATGAEPVSTRLSRSAVSD